MTSDYNQQLFAYLQTWRQLLEQWAAMTAGLPFPAAPPMMPTAPFMPAGGQFMPPMPPSMPMTPTAAAPPAPPGPAPADYTQQLFSYLQAWRQYLEQMTGTRPGPCPPRPPEGPVPPGDDAGSRAAAGSDTSKGSTPPPPRQVDIAPESTGGSQIVSTDFGQATPLVDIPPANEFMTEFRRPGFGQPTPFGGPDESQLLNPPDYAFGLRDRPSATTLPAGAVVYTTGPEVSRSPSEAPAQLAVNSPFAAMMERVGPTVSPQAEPISLFSAPAAQTAAARIGEAGQTQSP